MRAHQNQQTRTRPAGARRARSAAVLAALCVLAACRGADTGVFWQFERMLVQPRYEAYGGSPFFADGRAMRPPPSATVARGAQLEPPELLTGRTANGFVTAFPLPVTPELIAKGRRNFDIICAVCHGVAGDGQSVVGNKMPLKRPPSLHALSLLELPTGRIFDVVRSGYGLMPSYAPLLTVEQSWGVVAYVRALQLSQRATLADLPPALRARALQQVGQ